MDNEQVIKYISENSKNPRAAMIAEWLLTGWDVEYLTNNEEWVKATRPNWSPAVNYRLVKPKIKPAYRVYKHKDTRGSCVQDRYEDGTLSHTPAGNIEWLSDWIEYDPKPQQWPTQLVERIAAIDIKAAEWIADNWDDLLAGKYAGIGCNSPTSNRLDDMFAWGKSPQNNYYWSGIHKELGE